MGDEPVPVSAVNRDAMRDLAAQFSAVADGFSAIGAELGKSLQRVFESLSFPSPQLDAEVRAAHDRYRRDVVRRIPRRPESL